MHSTAEPIIAIDRLARLTTWASLWLAWIVSLAPGWTADSTQLTRMRRLTGSLIMLQAMARIRLRPRRAPAHPETFRNRGLGRVMIGSTLRRRLRRAGPGELLALMAAPENHVLRLARRLSRGHVRLRRLWFAVEDRAQAVRADPAKRDADADTS